jgi:hypothetical protein
MKDSQIRSREIVTCCQNGFASKFRQRIDGAIAEVELGPMAHSLSKAPKGCDGQTRLDGIKRYHLASQFLDQLVQDWNDGGAAPCPKNRPGFQERYRGDDSLGRGFKLIQQ